MGRAERENIRRQWNMAQSERKRKRRPEPGRGFAEILVLNDGGGADIRVSTDKTDALRAQMKGHPPLIFDARGNGGGAFPQPSREITKTG